MITVREFCNLVHNGPKDYLRSFRKYEHGDYETFMKRNHYPMPNLVSVKIREITSRQNDMHIGCMIYKIILEDDFDNDFEMTHDEMIKFFCEGKDDYDLLDFELYVEENDKYDHIPLKFFEGDTDYDNHIKYINIEENI